MVSTEYYYEAYAARIASEERPESMDGHIDIECSTLAAIQMHIAYFQRINYLAAMPKGTFVTKQ